MVEIISQGIHPVVDAERRSEELLPFAEYMKFDSNGQLLFGMKGCKVSSSKRRCAYKAASFSQKVLSQDAALGAFLRGLLQKDPKKGIGFDRTDADEVSSVSNAPVFENKPLRKYKEKKAGRTDVRLYVAEFERVEDSKVEKLAQAEHESLFEDWIYPENKRI